MVPLKHQKNPTENSFFAIVLKQESPLDPLQESLEIASLGLEGPLSKARWGPQQRHSYRWFYQRCLVNVGWILVGKKKNLGQ